MDILIPSKWDIVNSSAVNIQVQLSLQNMIPYGIAPLVGYHSS